MKHLIIKNFGPLKDVDISFKRINLFIGPQSSGKSCILKIACYCSYLEKRFELEQNTSLLKTDEDFMTLLVSFHKLGAYEKNNTFISYESDYMLFSYDSQKKKFSFSWKEAARWNYKRVKVSYIPAERNLVAAVPTWLGIKMKDNNILGFMSDWELVRKSFTEKNNLPVIDLGVSYFYDERAGRDVVNVEDNASIELTNASSGLQSVIPMVAFVNYHTSELFFSSEESSVKTKAENAAILERIYTRTYNRSSVDGTDESSPLLVARIGEKMLVFKDKESLEKCRNLYDSFTRTDHCDFFIEEPCAHLFPSTQSSLVKWLVERSNAIGRQNNLFISTHSPYLMTSFNNLIEAGNVYANKPQVKDKLFSIIPESQIVRFQDVSAYAIRNGRAVSLMNDEYSLIDANELDAVSDVISKEYSQILDL